MCTNVYSNLPPFEITITCQGETYGLEVVDGIVCYTLPEEACPPALDVLHREIMRLLVGESQ